MRRQLVVWLSLLVMSASLGLAQVGVSGTVYNDLDRDGTFDPTDGVVDVGADGIQMSISCLFFPSGLFFVDQTETDVADGTYAFTVNFFPGDLSGDCVVGIDPVSQLDPLLEATSPTSVSLLLDPFGGDVAGIDFGLSFKDVFLGDLVYSDDDGDGTFDPGDGETGLADIDVTAECIDTHGDVMTAAGTTAADGSYTLSVPCITPLLMDCTVEVDPSQLPGATPTTPTSFLFPGLAPGDEVFDADFGFQTGPSCTGAIGDFIWEDLDGDGIQDAGEPGLDGVAVTLFDDGGVQVDADVTGTDGLYAFGDLCAGTYQVLVDEATLPSPDLLPTLPDAGTDDTLDSDGGDVTVVLATDDASDTTIDAGYARCAACDGGIVALTLRYDGAVAASIDVLDPDSVFSALVQPGESFTFSRLDGAPFGDLEILVDGELEATLGTDCVSPVGPGLVLGELTVVAGSSALGGLLCPVAACVDGDRLDFEGLPAGTRLTEVLGALSGARVGVEGTNQDFLPGVNAALVFDSADPTGFDFDLGAPNEDFGGPGIGTGGEATSAFANDTALGNLLIVAENLVDADGDGLVDDPDDGFAQGNQLRLDFSDLGLLDVPSVSITGITAVDVENSEEPLTVEMFGPDGTLRNTVDVAATGNNGVARVDIERTSDVTEMVVTLRGSGAVDDIVFDCAPPAPALALPSCSVDASAAFRFDPDDLHWQLTNDGPTPLTIRSVEVHWPLTNGNLESVELDDVDLYAGDDLPLSVTIADWLGSVDDRRIQPGETREFEIDWFTTMTSGTVPNSCVNSCGTQAPGGCWCDEWCSYYGDCCSDKVAACDSGGTSGEVSDNPSDYTIRIEFEEGCTAVHEPAPCSVSGAATPTFDDDDLFWTLTNDGSSTVTLDRVTIDWPTASGDLRGIELDNVRLYDGDDPPGSAVLDTWSGALSARQLAPGESKTFEIEWWVWGIVADASQYSVQIELAEGCGVTWNP